MHVLMISLDTSILTQTIGDSRPRHERYAEQAGRISMVVCNRRGAAPLAIYKSERVTAQPTESRSLLNYVWDGYRAGLELCASERADLITTQDPFLTALVGMLLRRKTGAPLLIQIHASVLENSEFAQESRRNAVLQKLARWTVRRADAVRVVSEAERQACIRLGVDDSKVCVIPVPVKLDNFQKDAPASQIMAWYDRLLIDPDAPIILWVGRAVPVKDLPTLLAAFKQVRTAIPNAVLVLAGDMAGTDIPERVKQAGLTEAVRMIGPVAHADLPALYQIATAYAHASLHEGLGLVMIEAGAAGLPVVSTATDGAKEIVVEGETGYLVPVADSAALADRLIRVLKDPEAAQAMGERARARMATRFDGEKIATRWVAMWRGVAEKVLFPCGS